MRYKVWLLLLIAITLFSLTACVQEQTNYENSSIYSSVITSEEQKPLSEDVLKADIIVFESYFQKAFSTKDISISKENIEYYGTTNDWRIYSICYDGQLHSTALCSDTVGGYTFYKNIEYMPYPIAIYAINNKSVYTLKEAYNNGVIDIGEVYSFVPNEVKHRVKTGDG